MTKLKNTLFISDLHLDEKYPQVTAKFLHFLATLDSQTEAIYILGDLFELWIGDDDHSFYHQSIVNALRETTAKGIKIYFMAGNRDFLIGKTFLTTSGCHYLEDETCITLYGTPLLLMHGDTLCTGDIQYLKARKWARNKMLQFFFLLLPLSWRRRLATRLRMKSLRHTTTTSKEIMDVTPAEVVAVMQKYNTQYLIHGHTHLPNIHELSIQGKLAKRLVLGAWHQDGYVLSWNELGISEVIIF